jgi:hypothetical protein
MVQTERTWLIEHNHHKDPTQVNESIVFTRQYKPGEKYDSNPVYTVSFDESVTTNGQTVRGSVFLVAKYDDGTIHYYDPNTDNDPPATPLMVGQTRDVVVNKHELRVIIANGAPAPEFRWSGTAKRSD